MLEKMRDMRIDVAPYKATGTYVFKSVEEV
jgi:hypothetical protein